MFPRIEHWKQLVDGCKRNDRISQEKLYRRLYPALFTLCRKFFGDPHEAATALNTGMLKVFANIGRYDERRGEFFNWVYTTVRNTALTQLRGRDKMVYEELDETHSECPDEIPFDESDWEVLFGYLDQLPTATRVVCSLFYLEEFSVREIATELQIKEGTVKWHLNESRTRLRQLFTKNNP